MKNRNLKYYLGRHKTAIVFYFITIILASICSGATTLLMAQFLSHITIGAIRQGFMFLIIAGSSFVVAELSWWANYSLYFKYSGIIWKEIAIDLTERNFALSTLTFSENNSGTIVSRILDDSQEVLEKISRIIEVLASTITNLVIIIYIISLNWIIGLIYIAIIVGCFLIEIARRKVQKKHSANTKKAYDQSLTLVTEIVKSEKDVKTLGLDKKLLETSTASFENYRQRMKKRDFSSCNFMRYRTILLSVLNIGVLALGVYLMDTNMLTMASFILLFTYKNNLDEFIWNLGFIFKSTAEISVGTTRIFDLYDEDKYKIEKFGNKKLKDVKGLIEFKNVEFSYNKEDKENKQKVLENLSFTIEPNTSVAFVGKSGSGKSTILSLMSKLIETDKGRVSIDGNNINTLSKETLRDNISLINQFPYIFDMSIKDNLLLIKKDATNEELWEALKLACFDKDVKAMPQGIETKVGETGVKLSGGQRQRLAIARALLKQTKIIMFDESTSSLDNFAQSHIQQSIEEMKGKHTVVIVAHRLSTVKNVDKIFFLDEGKIVDEGTFEELFKNNKTFKTMFLAENL